jgi:hypothetical protein
LDDSLKELLAVNDRQALDFFVVGLRDAATGAVDGRELLYNASVLAHYAQVSTAAGADVPAPANLSFVFDNFVCDAAVAGDPAMMEIAGAQCLLLAGFFGDQMRGRFNLRWYASLGAAFFHRAAEGERSQPKAELLDALARRFEPWRQTHERLGRDLRDRPYLLPRREDIGRS